MLFFAAAQREYRERGWRGSGGYRLILYLVEMQDADFSKKSVRIRSIRVIRVPIFFITFTAHLQKMKIACWSVGKAHESYVKEGVEDFTRRISRYFKVEWTIIPVPKNAGMLSEMDLKKKEGELILQWLSKDDYLVVLDERGKQLSSEGLATFLQARANESAKQLVFLIGGAFGVDEAVLQRANYKWSLSPLVFPHQLVRLILAEQVYRACTILKNEKYHHK
jgi:23S rRNA (pseudouridine1915-N3)-methyltransferase